MNKLFYLKYNVNSLQVCSTLFTINFAYSILIIITIWNIWSRDFICNYEKIKALRSHGHGLKS